MEKLGLNQLRSMFQSFYEGKGHYPRKSFSLVPEKDKSLLIINSGMAPLKPYFAGLETPPSKRMTTCQKCIRTGDIENVGLTARHGTFFEMLGSFSFGDYFKTESLTWGWEFITQVLKMPVDKLWVSIYEEDEEAYDIWVNHIGINPEKIVRLGKDDNFWEIGIGPCGPCSEIYFDRGERYGCSNPDCKPGCECDRYVEFWNHVFTQFNRDENGNYTPLAHPNIDTGMGLERLACIMQDVDSIFNVDTISYILKGVTDISGVEYKEGAEKTDISLRIITDHIRSVAFMIADGIIPSNEGRGYVLRRLLRRAARHGKLLGIEGAFLTNLLGRVIEISKDAYPELEEKQDYIKKIIAVEEEKFSSTIDQGSEILETYMKEMAASGEKTLSGDKVFKLYDTYGFPLELTQEILSEAGLMADEDGFADAMKVQKETARAARKVGDEAGWAEDEVVITQAGATVFTGYSELFGKGIVKLLLAGSNAKDQANEGDNVRVVLDKTPFYAESGGQASDIGILKSDEFSAQVTSVSKVKNVFVHDVVINEGSLKVGDEVSAIVDFESRNKTAQNHTATHLLHKALRNILGTHIEQAGSSVTPDGLRFDFTHFEAIPKDVLVQIEDMVNHIILSFTPVHVEEMSMDQAASKGATALFGEKYGDVVRVVSVGDFSMELCGGTHLNNSGQIGAFKIVSEAGVAAGVRRIEAITGTGLLKPLIENQTLVSELSDALKTRPENLLSRAAALLDETKSLKKEIDAIKKETMGSSVDDIIADATEIKGVRLISRAFNDYTADDMRELCDQIKATEKGTIIVFASETNGQVMFIVSVTDDLLEKGYHAGNLIKKIAAEAGGGGGGKADMAQAGAKDPSKIADALALAETLI